MIDEELYQQAADELNSDARRPHLWARACALASDDHDEARYLYTNLRVEELIAERQAGGGKATDASSQEDHEAFELSLTPVSPPDADQESIASSRSGMDSEEDRSALSSFDEPPDAPDAPDAPVSTVRTETQLELDDSNEFGFDLESTAAIDDPLDNTLDQTLDDSLDRALDETQEELLQRSATAGQEGEAFSLDEIGGTPRHDDDGPELESTLVDEPHWLDQDTVFEPATSREPAVHDHVPDEPLEAPVLGHDEQAWSPAPAPADDPALPGQAAIRDPMADARDLDEVLAERPPLAVRDSDSDEEPEPLVDLQGSGPVWAVYEREDGRIAGLRRGISWGALLFTLPWLLWRGLIGTALVYGLLWVVSLGGLLLTGLAWSEAGADAPGLLRAVCASFAAITLIGLIVLPFMRANRWRETAWQRRGDVLRGEVRAKSSTAAVRRIADHDLDYPTGNRSVETVAA